MLDWTPDLPTTTCMHVPPLLAILLEDAVDRIAQAPYASFRWHMLGKLLGANPDAAVRAWLQALVLARLPADGEAGFLRATFLADLNGDPACTAQAAQQLLLLAPFDAERVMAFASYQWGRAVADLADHQHFIDALRNARLPDLMHLAGQRLSALASLPRRPVTSVRKVALLVPMLGNAIHPPTDMALQQAALLTALGCAVTLYACQELVQPMMEHHLGFPGHVVAPLPDLAALPARLPPGVQVTLADSRLSMMRRWREVLAVIARDDPDLVMFVGLNSPLLQPLYEARPVLGLGVHALAPMAPVDVWLAADPEKAACASSTWGNAMPPAFGHHHPYRVLRKAAPPLQRKDLDLPADALVLLTVGARLASEINGPWAQRMLAVLERHPRTVWLLAGGIGEVPAALQGARPGQVRTSPHRADLGGVYRLSDVVINPPRVGGGLSTAEAMAEGVPVLALAGGDSGHKMGNLAMADDTRYFAVLDELLTTPTLRASMGQAMRQRFDDTLDLSRSGPSLRAACELAVARFAMRQPSS